MKNSCVNKLYNHRIALYANIVSCGWYRFKNVSSDLVQKSLLFRLTYPSTKRRVKPRGIYVNSCDTTVTMAYRPSPSYVTRQVTVNLCISNFNLASTSYNLMTDVFHQFNEMISRIAQSGAGARNQSIWRQFLVIFQSSMTRFSIQRHVVSINH